MKGPLRRIMADGTARKVLSVTQRKLRVRVIVPNDACEVWMGHDRDLKKRTGVLMPAGMAIPFTMQPGQELWVIADTEQTIGLVLEEAGVS